MTSTPNHESESQPAIESARDVQSERRAASRSWFSAPRDVVVLFTLLFVAIEGVSALTANIPVTVALFAVGSFVALNVAIFGHRTERTAGLVMAGVFTTRLITFALPLQDVAFTTRALLLGPLMILIAIVVTRVLRIDLRSGRANEGFPLKEPFISKGFVALLTLASGPVVGWIAYQLTEPSPIHIGEDGMRAILLWGVAILALCAVGMGEELIFRRTLAAMVQHTGNSQVPWFSATIYAATFFGTLNYQVVILAFLAGAFWAASCERTGSIELVVVAHCAALITAYGVLP